MKIFPQTRLRELNFDLDAVTTADGRLYSTPSGKKYPSITTVLSGYNKKGIMEWRARVGEQEANRVSRLASSRGSKLHTVCENYLVNELSDIQIRTMMPDTKSLFVKMRKVMDEHITKVYAIEQPLYSDELRIAGRVDCIAEWDGILSIVDWKTASKLKQESYIRNYFMQCTAYAEMFEYVTKMPIEQVVVAIAVECEEPQIFVRSKYDYLADLRQEIDNYYLNNPTINSTIGPI